jgi:hypothetical protein
MGRPSNSRETQHVAFDASPKFTGINAARNPCVLKVVQCHETGMCHSGACGCRDLEVVITNRSS